jgi:uncharacterized membrane protein YqjE
MKTEKENTRRELWDLCFLGCLFFGFGLIVLTAKFLIFDQPSERMEELQNDWPVVLFSILFIVVGWRGRRYFKKNGKRTTIKKRRGRNEWNFAGSLGFHTLCSWLVLFGSHRGFYWRCNF